MFYKGLTITCALNNISIPFFSIEILVFKTLQSLPVFDGKSLYILFSKKYTGRIFTSSSLRGEQKKLRWKKVFNFNLSPAFNSYYPFFHSQNPSHSDATNISTKTTSKSSGKTWLLN